MKVLGSRTILQLYVLGLVAVALPLLCVLVTAVLSVDSLVKRSQRAIFLSGDTVDASRRLVEQGTDVARSGRQFLVLGEDEVYKVYIQARAQFHAAVDELAGVGLDEAHRQILERTRARERKVYEALEQYRKEGGSASDLEDGFREITGLARAMFNETSRLLGREAGELRQAAGEIERRLLLESAAVIPLTIALGTMLTFLVARPMRQMDGAVRQLGRGQFGTRIRVRGARDLAELGRRLEWLRERLLALERQKVTFLRHVSHELKTPLATLREGSELLRDQAIGPLNERQSDAVRIVNESSHRLQGLIEDLLRVSVEERREDRRSPESFALERVVRNVLFEQRLSIASRRLKTIKKLGRISVSGREEQIRVVVENLISNAIKYSPEGGRIEVTLQEQNGLAVLEVRDEGPGIDAEDRERIFEAFYQGRTVMGSVKGTGLGLTIAREYAALHGGRIEVMDSERGAHLRVSVPLRAQRGWVGGAGDERRLLGSSRPAG